MRDWMEEHAPGLLNIWAGYYYLYDFGHIEFSAGEKGYPRELIADVTDAMGRDPDYFKAGPTGRSCEVVWEEGEVKVKVSSWCGFKMWGGGDE
jgi:hypothetical protein